MEQNVIQVLFKNTKRESHSAMHSIVVYVPSNTSSHRRIRLHVVAPPSVSAW